MSADSASGVFDLVIVTAPTERIARVYQTELNALKVHLPCLLGCIDIRCVPDPEGRRVGSGGGTLNALEHAIRLHGQEILRTCRTLVIHSGGDSRRAPFHSGKTTFI